MFVLSLSYCLVLLLYVCSAKQMNIEHYLTSCFVLVPAVNYKQPVLTKSQCKYLIQTFVLKCVFNKK